MFPISTAIGFPKEDVAQDVKKKKEYGLAVAQAIYSRWYNAAVPYGFANMAYFRMLREYAQGRQSTLQYKKRYRGESNNKNGNKVNHNGSLENSRKGYNNIAFDIESPAPVYITIIKSLLKQHNYEPSFYSTTKADIKTKTKMKAKLWAESQYENPQREKYGLEPKKQPWYPQSLPELEVYEKYHGFRLPLEVALTKIARHSFDVSNWDMLFDQYIDSACETSFLVGKVNTNKDGSTYLEYIDSANFVTTYYDQKRNEEPVFAGHVTKVQLGSIKDKLIEQGATEQDIRNLAQMYAPYNGVADYQNYDYNSKDPVTQRYMWYDFSVDVMFFEWKTDDQKHFVGRQASNGNYVYKREDRVKRTYADGRERKTDTYYQQMVYEGAWVIGTKYIYDYGLKKNMLRTPNGGCALSYVFERIEKKSIVEAWMPLLDDYQMGVLKYRAAVQAAAPKGYAVDAGLIAQQDMGAGKMNGLQMVQYRRETGNYIFQTPAAILQSGRNMSNAMQELEGGIGAQQVEWMRHRDFLLEKIKTLAGLNDAVAATPSASGEKGLGIAKLEISATNNALGGIQTALRNFKQKAALKLVAQTRLNIEADAKCAKYWEDYLEPQYFSAIKAIGDLTLNGIGIKMREGMSAERKATILGAATESLKAGKNGLIGITISDFMLVEKTLEDGEPELASWYLTIAEERARAVNEQAQSRMSKENAENSIAANQAAMQSKAQLEQMLSQLRMQEDGAKIAAELEAKAKLLELEHTYTMQELALEGSIQATTSKEVRGKI